MRRIPLADELRRTRPDVIDPEAAIASGRVRVDGVVIHNPRSLVRRGCAIVIEAPGELRGSAKLKAALDTFSVDVTGRICLDVGASTGGFTTVLLERGAALVYAVDAGHGQLLGSLRQDPRVVNLEATNVAELTTVHVPEPIDLVAIDVSYLSLCDAATQVARVTLSPTAELVGLVKPMFELKLGSAPTDQATLDRAIDAASSGLPNGGWDVVASMGSALRGARGAIEGWVHARRLVG